MFPHVLLLGMESLHLQHLFYCKYLLYSRVRVEGVRMRVKAHVKGTQGVQCVRAQGVRHARVHKLLRACVYALWVRVTRVGQESGVEVKKPPSAKAKYLLVAITYLIALSRKGMDEGDGIGEEDPFVSCSEQGRGVAKRERVRQRERIRKNPSISHLS